jgi:hypothetical protein
VGTISSYELNHYGPSWSFAVGTSNAPIGTTTKTMSHTDYTGSFSPFAISEGGSALPVEMISFSAACKENTVKLVWKTASENNSLFYDVEKSRDGEYWSVIEQVPAAGNSTETLEYTVTDIEQSDETVYYRLNQVDQNGHSKIYGPIAVLCSETSDFSVVAFPNPTSGEVALSIQVSFAQHVKIQLFGADGRTIISTSYALEEGSTQLPFNLETLKPGMYTVLVQGEQTMESIQLIVK